MESFEDTMRRGGEVALRSAARFFVADDPVYAALKAITGKLRDLKIEYAVGGGMALVAHGYRRTTVDIAILLTSEGLDEVHRHLDGHGYVPPFSGSRNLRDTETGVRIEFLIAGQYPGDGQPKPVAFPRPAEVAVEKDGMSFLQLTTLIELKLASGMTNPGRLKDLADVQELIRALGLPSDLAGQLNAFVRGRYDELWRAVHDSATDH